MKKRSIHAIIPARYDSTRFPGKPLVLLHGKPMFWHVWSRASRCELLSSVTLATDDERIAKVSRSYNIPTCMTKSDHASGTDRVYEAALSLGLEKDSIVINIQGDEPAVNPNCLDILINAFSDTTVCAATLAKPITIKEASSADVVKVVCAINGDALYFSRLPIPYDRDTTNSAKLILGHMGIYAFSLETLAKFVTFAPSPLENTERLEQLRLLENGIALRVAISPYKSPGVDKPEDIEAVLPLLEN